eukprot:TRINITY_DN10220_c0_g1_i9.p1 TRINITY_DN10220_c0_g1~~TRINITY_DN10220_c0_g1_i9.p1  ORF type:complete len:185 (+),score=63.43 TRINITY_DN10220_c0_g1_i9:199-753(+)
MSWWDRCHLTPPDEILPDFMWLGDKRGALVMNKLPFETFTHVVFATNELTSPYPARHYLCIKLSDDADTDLFSRFEECNQFIEEARRAPDSRVLVHCRMGQSRSTTLVVAYIMSHYQCSLKEAVLWVKQHREIICPNPGFFVQLQQYEKQLFGCEYPSLALGAARKQGVCSVSKLKDRHGNITE